MTLLRELFRDQRAGLTVYSPDFSQIRLWGNLDHAIHEATGFQIVRRRFDFVFAETQILAHAASPRRAISVITSNASITSFSSTLNCPTVKRMTNRPSTRVWVT